MKGYVYALINPSLPNMVKVGQTTRNPEDRAREISSATGVPTPFIVGYSILVSNCEDAESHAHELLTQKGIRVTANREFFHASLQEIVRVLIELENQYPNDEIPNDYDSEEYEREKDLDEIIEELLSEAFLYYYGSDDTFEDHYAAEGKYLAAIRLGSNKAKSGLGYMYADEDSDVYNPKKAVRLLMGISKNTPNRR